MGKLLLGVLGAIMAGVVALIALGKKSSGGGDTQTKISDVAKEIKKELDEKPQEKIKAAVSKQPEVVKQAIVIADSEGKQHQPTPPATSPSSGSGDVATTQAPDIAKHLAKLQRLWDHAHNVEDYRDGPKFNAKEWLRNPIMPYQVRSGYMDRQMSSCLWYSGDLKYAKELEANYLELAKRFNIEVKEYQAKYAEFLKLVESKQPIPANASFVSEYLKTKSDTEADSVREAINQHYPTTSWTMGKELPAVIKSRMDKYSKAGADLIDYEVMNEYVELAFKARKEVVRQAESYDRQLRVAQDTARRTLREIENSVGDDASLMNSYIPHIRDIRSAGLKLSSISSVLNAYYVRTNSAETTVLLVLGNYRDFAVTMNKLNATLNK